MLRSGYRVDGAVPAMRCKAIHSMKKSSKINSPADRSKRGFRKRVRIGEALRKIGFDEYAIAQRYADTVDRLKDKSDRSGNVEKLLIDVLKECSRLIEPMRPETASDRAGVRSAALHVHLVHNVPRPTRAALPAAGTSPVILDVSSPEDSLPPAEEPQAKQELARDSELALKSDAS